VTLESVNHPTTILPAGLTPLFMNPRPLSPPYMPPKKVKKL